MIFGKTLLNIKCVFIIFYYMPLHMHVQSAELVYARFYKKVCLVVILKASISEISARKNLVLMDTKSCKQITAN
jgi:hypothetical protein